MRKRKGENVFARRRQQKTVREGNRREADGGVPHVRFKKLAGARRLRWSPASNHGETGRSECTKSFSVSFRVGGWWTRPSESTTSTATLSPADGGSGDGGELRWVLQTPNSSACQKCGCIRKLLARDGRQWCTHGSESSWIPWRVAAAGVEEGDSLGALPVARRGLGGVQRWCGY